MSVTAETRHNVEAAEGFISDEDKAEATPLMCGDSLYDAFPFEYLDDLLIWNLSDATTPKGVETVGQRADLDRPRLRSIPDVYRIMDWVMGRSVMVQKNQRSSQRLSEDFKASEASVEKGRKEDVGGHTLLDDSFVDIGDVQDICPACTTPYCQAIDSLPFKSSLRLNYNDPETHTWFIGDKYVMTETVDEQPNEIDVTLSQVTELIKKSTRVPVPNVVAGWRENGKVITIAERAPGQRLYDIWWNLQNDERERIAREVGRYIDQWRRNTADRISSLSGGSVWHYDNLFGTLREGFGPFKSDEQLWDTIHRRLKRNKVDQRVVQVLKDYMPESTPCVLTHGDLSCTNILIHNGRISAILGFDNAACLPVWAENIAMHFCCCKEDEQWKAMLSRHVKSYARAKDWWSLWTAAESKTSDKKRIAALIARCCRWQKPPEKKRAFHAEATDEERVQEGPSQQQAAPEPQQRSPRRNGFQVQTTRSPFRAALSRKLLRDIHYSDLINNPLWESATASPSEESAVERYGEESFLPTEQQPEQEPEIEGAESQNAWEEAQGEINQDDSFYAKRMSIERWLSENERGRKALPRQMSFQRLSGETSSYLSVAKEPPWRERQRSFERRDNDSKGLRPLSLPLSHLAETLQHNLRGVDENEADDGDDNREKSLQETLRSLESGQPDDAGPAVDALQTESEQARYSQGAEKKRTSIFRGRNAPGSLYLAVVNAAAEGRNRRQRRSQSEERAAAGEGRAADQGRQRPQSLMPQVGQTGPEDPVTG
ncbi:hypothetical protein F4677DRAFT_436993 [Hypoxylon crocopeplum]|nr:hypothetical protein F4677DRAFT_436993 [Hypoxylon crocopeplum]